MANVTPKKRSIIQTVIEDKLLSELVSGSIWKLTEEEIIAHKDTLDKFRKTLGAAFKMYDDELKNQRKIHGDDHLKNVSFFRKPRAQKDKSENDLLSEFDF